MTHSWDGTSPYAEIGGSVYDRFDKLVHRVVQLRTISCVVACQEYWLVGDPWCRIATDYLATDPSAPRWKVDAPVNCMECIACLIGT